jgi:hypothetical protein
MTMLRYHVSVKPHVAVIRLDIYMFIRIYIRKVFNDPTFPHVKERFIHALYSAIIRCPAVLHCKQFLISCVTDKGIFNHGEI